MLSRLPKSDESESSASESSSSESDDNYFGYSSEEVYANYNEQQFCKQLELELKEINESRKEVHVPKSLLSLTIKSVLINCTQFINTPDSPLTYLSNSVIQKFLDVIASGISHFNLKADLSMLHIPEVHLRHFLQLLVNPRVTELDCTRFDIKRKNLNIHDFLLEHALNYCPDIRKVKLMYTRSKKRWPYHPQKVRGRLPLERFKQSWKQLSCIIADRSFSVTDQCLLYIHRNFPNIECLKFSLEDVSTAGVNSIIAMKKLHTLELNDVSTAGVNSIIAMKKLHTLELNGIRQMAFADLVKIAGEVPSLQDFSFSFHKQQNQFVNEFGHCYPSKQLLVHKLGIKKNLNVQWPKHLQVECLGIEGSLDARDIKHLSCINFDLNLSLENVPAEVMYQLLESKLGIHVIRLVIIFQEKNKTKDTSVVLERVLSACPNLQQFKFCSSEPVAKDPKYSLPPQAFNNYAEFIIVQQKNSTFVQKDAQAILLFERYLIETKKCKKLVLTNLMQLETASKVALAHPESLQQLEEVHIDFFIDNEDYHSQLCLPLRDLLTCCLKLRMKVFPKMLAML